MSTGVSYNGNFAKQVIGGALAILLAALVVGMGSSLVMLSNMSLKVETIVKNFDGSNKRVDATLHDHENRIRQLEEKERNGNVNQRNVH